MEAREEVPVRDETHPERAGKEVRRVGPAETIVRRRVAVGRRVASSDLRRRLLDDDGGRWRLRDGSQKGARQLSGKGDLALGCLESGIEAALVGVDPCG